MENKDAISEFFDNVIKDLVTDAQSKGQKFPVDSFTKKVSNIDGQLLGADYIKYLVYGRGPGKQPPPDKMLKSVQQHPEWLQSARKTFAKITEKGLAYLIGRKIAREGTEIYKGKKPGVDLLGSIEKNFPKLSAQLVRNSTFELLTSLKREIK